MLSTSLSSLKMKGLLLYYLKFNLEINIEEGINMNVKLKY